MGWQRIRLRHEAGGPVDGQVTQLHQAGDEAFWTSPVGNAARAKLRGDRFFQIEADDATLAAYAAVACGRRARRSKGATDLLGQIEELGWRLEHVTLWPVVGEPAGSGRGRVRGVYLFRAETTESADEQPSSVATARLRRVPSHRFDVL